MMECMKSMGRVQGNRYTGRMPGGDGETDCDSKRNH